MPGPGRLPGDDRMEVTDTPRGGEEAEEDGGALLPHVADQARVLSHLCTLTGSGVVRVRAAGPMRNGRTVVEWRHCSAARVRLLLLFGQGNVAPDLMVLDDIDDNEGEEEEEESEDDLCGSQDDEDGNINDWRHSIPAPDCTRCTVRMVSGVGGLVPHVGDWLRVWDTDNSSSLFRAWLAVKQVVNGAQTDLLRDLVRIGAASNLPFPVDDLASLPPGSVDVAVVRRQETNPAAVTSHDRHCRPLTLLVAVRLVTLCADDGPPVVVDGVAATLHIAVPLSSRDSNADEDEKEEEVVEEKSRKRTEGWCGNGPWCSASPSPIAVDSSTPTASESTMKRKASTPTVSESTTKRKAGTRGPQSARGRDSESVATCTVTVAPRLTHLSNTAARMNSDLRSPLALLANPKSAAKRVAWASVRQETTALRDVVNRVVSALQRDWRARRAVFDALREACPGDVLEADMEDQAEARYLLTVVPPAVVVATVSLPSGWARVGPVLGLQSLTPMQRSSWSSNRDGSELETTTAAASAMEVDGAAYGYRRTWKPRQIVEALVPRMVDFCSTAAAAAAAGAK